MYSKVTPYKMSKASQDDNYCTAIDDDDLDKTVQFGDPVTQPFLLRSVRVLKFYTNVLRLFT